MGVSLRKPRPQNAAPVGVAFVSMVTVGGGTQLVQGEATASRIAKLRVNPVGSGLPLAICRDGRSSGRNQEAVLEAQQHLGKKGRC